MHVDSIISDLKRGGHRITKIRRALIEIFSRIHSPLSAPDLLAQLGKLGLGANKSTVYRELAFLKEVGVLTEVQLGQTHRLYELSSLEHHHHLVCKKCERLEDVEFAGELAEIEREIWETKGFEITSHSLEFFGLCRNCR